MLLQDEQYVVKWLSQYGALPKTQIIRMLQKPEQTAEKILRNLKKQMQIADVSGGYYIGLDPMCRPDQRVILAVWVLLKFIDYVDPMAHYPAVYPSQLFFLKENIGYEIVVLYEGEQSQLRLLQPQEDLKYIIIVPHIAMAEKLKLPEAQMVFVRRFYQDANFQAAYDAALRLEEISERLVLLTRRLPAYTGCPIAEVAVENCIAENIPVEIGFTAEGWFALRIPALLPKKSSGSADYIRSFLYPAMRSFFESQPPVRYRDCVLIYRHVYSRDRPERQKRDHDNIEVNMVSDIVALYVMPDDSPKVCAHYYCSVSGMDERTEVYVVPKKDFPLWLVTERAMPDEGVRLYETQKI